MTSLAGLGTNTSAGLKEATLAGLEDATPTQPVLENIRSVAEHRQHLVSLWQTGGNVEIAVAHDQPQKRVIRVHEELLRNTPVFEKMLTCGFEETKTKKIDLQAHSERVVRDFVAFLYLGTKIDLNYYLTRPSEWFGALAFSEQFFLHKFRVMVIEGVVEVLQRLQDLVSAPTKHENWHCVFFAKFSLSTDEKWSKWKKETGNPAHVNLHSNIIRCMQFVVENFEQLAQLDPISKSVKHGDLYDFVVQVVRKSVSREGSLLSWRSDYFVSDSFMEVLPQAFTGWLKKHAPTNLLIDLLFLR